jgi:beta-galactosidase
VWTEALELRGATEVAGYLDGPVPGVPALTRNPVGHGTAWYLATRVRPSGTAALVRELCAVAGIEVHDRGGVEVVRRQGDGASYLFVINHTDDDAEVAATGTDLVSGRGCAGTLRVAAGGVAVVREEVA